MPTPSDIDPYSGFKIRANALGRELACCAEAALKRILAAEKEAVARIGEYVPQDRLLTLKEAAAYLGYTERTLSAWTTGEGTKIQYRMLGGEKRFRLQWLNEAVDNAAVSPRKVTL